MTDWLKTSSPWPLELDKKVLLFCLVKGLINTILASPTVENGEGEAGRCLNDIPGKFYLPLSEKKARRKSAPNIA
jgi:hypothetical protein